MVNRSYGQMTLPGAWAPDYSVVRRRVSGKDGAVLRRRGVPARFGSGFRPRRLRVLGQGSFAHGLAVGADDAVGVRRGVTAMGYLSCGGAARLDDAELRAQAYELERYCARRGWHVAEMVHDVEAPRRRSLRQPGLGYALERVRRGDASCLVVT